MSSDRIEFAKASLIGLSIGDAFGETFFCEENQILDRITKRELNSPLWHFTDDTIMDSAIYKIWSSMVKSGRISLQRF